MADNLPSSTSENGGSNKSATNKSSDENGGQTEKQFKPPDSSKRKKPRLTKTEWREFIGILALILWIWSEVIKCHDLSILCLLGMALLLLYAAACYFVLKLFKLKLLFRGLIIWIFLAIFTAGVVDKNSLPLMKTNSKSETNSPALELTLQELSNRLQKTMSQFEDATNALAESEKPKSIKVRLIDFLNEIDPKIISQLRTKSIPVHCVGKMSDAEASVLEKLAQEPEANEFIVVHMDGNVYVSNNGIDRNVNFDVSPNLLK